tara:strand:+ start:147 stop:524 length:378 start_codon:yes stop_codon:yes gene_type:complete
MSEKQLLHEINSSREATEEIRKQVLQAKQKGYFNSTKFGRHFLSTFVPDFAKELLQTTSKTAWGRATTTNIVVAYPLRQEAISLLDPEGYVTSQLSVLNQSLIALEYVSTTYPEQLKQQALLVEE